MTLLVTFANFSSNTYTKYNMAMDFCPSRRTVSIGLRLSFCVAAVFLICLSSYVAHSDLKADAEWVPSSCNVTASNVETCYDTTGHPYTCTQVLLTKEVCGGNRTITTWLPGLSANTTFCYVNSVQCTLAVSFWPTHSGFDNVLIACSVLVLLFAIILSLSLPLPSRGQSHLP